MRVTLDNLRADMVLAADVVDSGGRLLLPNGTALTDKHLRYCQMWGVIDADIVGNEDVEAAVDPGYDPETVAKAEALVAPRFAHVDRGHPAIEALLRYCVQVQLKKGA